MKELGAHICFRNYEFNIGDEVIDTDGVRGTITRFIDGNSINSVYSNTVLEWTTEDGDNKFLGLWEQTHFKDYYKIGKYFFSPFRKDELKQCIAKLEDRFAQAKKRLAVMEEYEEG